MLDHPGGARSQHCERTAAQQLPVGAAAALLACLLLLPGCSRSRGAALHTAPRTPGSTPARPGNPESTPVLELAEGEADSRQPASDAQSTRLSLRLDLTEITPEQLLTGTLRGRFGDDSVRLLWVDGLDRVVAAGDVQPPAANENSSKFSVKLPAGAAGQLQRLVLVRASKSELKKLTGASEAFKFEAQVSFRVMRAPAWNDYVAVLEGACESFPAARLQPHGIQAGFCTAAESGAALVRQNVPFFSDALAPEANTLIQRQDWAQLLERFVAQRGEATWLQRQPALFEDGALQAARTALDQNLLSKRQAQPLAWSLGEGLSITQGVSPFDFDLSPASVEVFQAWLEEQYQSIAALNRQWGTHYKSWREVQPQTTDQAKAAQLPAYAEKLHAAAPEIAKAPQPEDGEAGAAPSPAPPAATNFELTAEELPAPGRENFSAWSDFRSFNDFAFARLLREYRGWLRAREQNSPVGLLRAQPPAAFGGWDWWQLSQNLDWLEEHHAPFTRVLLKSFAPRVQSLTKLYAAQGADRYCLWEAWVRGDSGCILAAGAGLNPESGPLAPEAQALGADLRLLGSGLTTLRNSAKLTHDPIAIYYSPRSWQAHWLLDSRGDGAKWIERNAQAEALRNSARLGTEAWLMLLEDLGYEPRFLHPQQLMAGELSVRDTRVLILPKVLCLSDAEAREIRAFVRRGGVVLADGACGTFDGLGKRRVIGYDPRPVGALDSDFGISRADFVVLESNGEYSGDLEAARVTLRDGLTRQPIGPSSPELRILEPGVTATGGWSYAAAKTGAAALISKSGGLGRFIYLNLALQDYPELRAKATDESFVFHGLSPDVYAGHYGAPSGGEALRLVLSDTLSALVPDNPLQVRSAEGLPLRGIKRSRLALGEKAWLLALLPLAKTEYVDQGPARLSAVALTKRTEAWAVAPWECHWYDLQLRQYLGQGSRAKLTLEPHRAALLAALPYKVERLHLKVRRTDPRGTFRVQANLALTSGQAAQHVLRVEVFDPAGKGLAHYDQNVATNAGAWNGTISLGLNEPVGKYLLRVRDLISGNSAEFELIKDQAEYGAALQNAKAPH